MSNRRAGMKQCPPPLDQLDALLTTIRIDVRHHHREPAAGKVERARAPDPGPAPCDDCYALLRHFWNLLIAAR